MEKGKIHRGLILLNERASENYTTDFLARIYGEEGRGIFSGQSRNLSWSKIIRRTLPRFTGMLIDQMPNNRIILSNPSFTRTPIDHTVSHQNIYFDTCQSHLYFDIREQ